MNIVNLINEFKKGNKFELVPVTSFEVECPYCHEEIVKHNIVQNKLSHAVWENLDGKGYSYNDGDTIVDIEKNIKLTWKQYDAQLLQGQCRKCNKQYAGICIDLINPPVKDDCFYICDDSIFYESNVKSELLQINLNGNKIGVLYIFKNVNFSNSVYDIYTIELGAFELPTDLRGEHGVACCSLTEVQKDIWKNATELCQFIINDFTNNHSYLNS